MLPGTPRRGSYPSLGGWGRSGSTFLKRHYLSQRISNSALHWDHLESFKKIRMLRPPHSIIKSGSSGVGPGISSYKAPGDSNVQAKWRTTRLHCHLEGQTASFSAGQVKGTGERDLPADCSQPSGIGLHSFDLATFRYV